MATRTQAVNAAKAKQAAANAKPAAKPPAKVATPQPTPRRQKAAPPPPPPAAQERPPGGAVVAQAPSGTAVALSDRLKAHAVRQREEIAKAPATTGNVISFRGGTMTLNDQPLGNELQVIILAAQFERSYYPGAFTPGEAVVPSCYSRDNIAPAEEAAYQQSDECKGCRWNEFETAREGTGKACKEGLKLAMVAAETAGGEGTPVIAQARLSVLNAKAIRQDLNGIQAQPNIDHTVQAVCTLKVVPDQRSQYKASLIFDGYTPADVVDKLVGLIEPAVELLNEPYPASMALDPKEAEAKSKPKRTVKSY